MKKIIEGKSYNTTTAKTIYCYDNGLPLSDFNAYQETLHLTQNGAWFLHGQGGANTVYCTDTGSLRMAGEDIRLISAQEAQEWLENHQEYFGLISVVTALETYFEIQVG